MMPASAGGMAAVQSGGGGFKPRTDVFGQPLQSTQFGTCKFPTCNFPKRIEGNKVHDFCSRTCAKNFSQLPPQMQATISSGGQVMVVGQGQPIGGSGGLGMGGQQQQPAAPGPTNQTAPGSAASMSAASYQSQSVTVVSKGQAMCKKCQKQPANPGRGWCQSCYINKS